MADRNRGGRGDRPRPGTGVRGAWRPYLAVLRDPTQRTVQVGLVALSAHGASVVLALIVLAERELSLSAFQLGLVLGAAGVGGLVASAVAGRYPGPFRTLPGLAATLALSGVLLVGLAVAPRFWWALVANALVDPPGQPAVAATRAGYGYWPVPRGGAPMSRRGLPKLVATDLDGTLVRSDDTVSRYSHEVLERVRAAGIWVVGATGRGPRLLELTRRDLPSAGHLVLAGGGRVVHLPSHGAPEVLLDVRLRREALVSVLERLERRTGPLTVVVEERDDADAPLLCDGEITWPWPEPVVRVPRERLLARDVIKAFIQVNGDVDELVRLGREVVPPTVASLTQAGLGYVEICPPGVDKATGLAVVAEALGVDPGEVLVFGDMPNDVPMFTWAGWRRVAVANAHPEVLALADEVTLTNDEDGVAVWLDNLLSG